MSAEPPTTIEPDEQNEVEIAPGLLRLDLGEGRSELLSVAYGIPLDEPPRPEHAKAVELYTTSVCDRLAALIEPDPGFRTPKHRRDFWIMIQVWARYVLDRLAAAEDREQGQRNKRKLTARLTRLRKDADRLHEAVNSGSGGDRGPQAQRGCHQGPGPGAAYLQRCHGANPQAPPPRSPSYPAGTDRSPSSCSRLSMRRPPASGRPWWSRTGRVGGAMGRSAPASPSPRLPSHPCSRMPARWSTTGAG